MYHMIQAQKPNVAQKISFPILAPLFSSIFSPYLKLAKYGIFRKLTGLYTKK